MICIIYRSLCCKNYLVSYHVCHTHVEPREYTCFLATKQQQHGMAAKTVEMSQNARRVFINDIDKYTSKNIARVRFINCNIIYRKTVSHVLA